MPHKNTQVIIHIVIMNSNSNELEYIFIINTNTFSYKHLLTHLLSVAKYEEIHSQSRKIILCVTSPSCLSKDSKTTKKDKGM